MSETWADAQFDMLEAAYDEVPIEAKARIAELARENAEDLQMLANQAATIKGQIEGLHARDALIRDLWTAITWMHGMGDAKRDELRRRIRDMGIDLDGEVDA